VKKLVFLFSIGCLYGADLRVDLSQAGKKVSPNQFGLFLEEINHAGDGGLYAELVRNGSFSEATILEAWSPVQTGSARVNAFFDTTNPLNAAKARSLRVEISSGTAERAGISNEGYWGIAVKKGESYEFSTYARAAAGFDGPLTVALEGKDGALYGQAQITGLKTAWSVVSASIQSSTTDPAARLTITANRNATFWLNVVSLRPGKDIFRADLVQKLDIVMQGKDALQTAIKMKADYFEAMAYLNLLWRQQALLETDPVKAQEDIAQADAVRNKAVEIIKQKKAQQAGGKSS